MFFRRLLAMSVVISLLLWTIAATAQDYDPTAPRNCTDVELSTIDRIAAQFLAALRTTEPNVEALVNLQIQYHSGEFGSWPDCFSAQQLQRNYAYALDYLLIQVTFKEDGRSQLAEQYGSLVPAFSDAFWSAACHLIADSSCTDQAAESTLPATTTGNETTFTVTVNSNANLRSCAGTSCTVIGSAGSGSVLTVLETVTASDGDWYRVRTNEGEAYIAAQLTTRGADTIIDVSQPYFDPSTNCTVAIDVKRGSALLHVILTGDGMQRIQADIYRPNETTPLPVESQYTKTFIDTGELYLDQFYRWNVGWPTGLYQLEVQYGGNTSRLGWQMETQGEYAVFVVCS